MNFFGMGPLELLVVLVLALVFIGPEKLPEMAAQLGKAYRDLRRMTTELSAEFRDSMQEFQSVQEEVAELQKVDLGLQEAPTAAPQPAQSATAQPADSQPGAAVSPGVSTESVPAAATSAAGEARSSPQNGRVGGARQLEEIQPPY